MRERITEEELQAQEREEFYPPRFQIFLATSQRGATLSDGRIEIRGALNCLKFDIYLDSSETVIDSSETVIGPPFSDDHRSIVNSGLFRAVTTRDVSKKVATQLLCMKHETYFRC